MVFDNLCKLLAEKHPVHFASWVLGQPIESAEVLKSELSVKPIRADSVILLKLQGQILHLEFQVKLDSDPLLPLRMLDYWVRLHRLYRLPIRQVVVLLRPPAEGTVIETVFVLGTTRHEYQVMCMWEQDPSTFLEDVSLLPLATLAATQFPEQLLNQVAQRVSTIESAQQRRESSAYAQLLAGLRFNKTLIRQVFREGIMRESVIYQEIQQEGEERGILKGEQAVILRQLAKRFGEVSPEIQSQIQALSLYQLEALADALLDFSSFADLRTWLQTSQS